MAVEQVSTVDLGPPGGGGNQSADPVLLAGAALELEAPLALAPSGDLFSISKAGDIVTSLPAPHPSVGSDPT
jgi:hypothetical protein